MPVLSQTDLDDAVDKEGLLNPSLVTLKGEGGGAVVRSSKTHTLVTDAEDIEVVPSVMLDVYLVNNEALLLQDSVVPGYNEAGAITSFHVPGTATGDVLFIYQYESQGEVIDRGYELTQDDVDTKKNIAGLVNPSNVILGGVSKYSELVVITGQDIPVDVGDDIFSFRSSMSFNLTRIKASLNTPQVSGFPIEIDVLVDGTTVFSTPLTFDNGTTTTLSAATLPVISNPLVADDSVVSISVKAIGDGTATGLKVQIEGDKQ